MKLLAVPPTRWPMAPAIGIGCPPRLRPRYRSARSTGCLTYCLHWIASEPLRCPAPAGRLPPSALGQKRLERVAGPRAQLGLPRQHIQRALRQPVQVGRFELPVVTAPRDDSSGCAGTSSAIAPVSKASTGSPQASPSITELGQAVWISTANSRWLARASPGCASRGTTPSQ